MRVAEQNLRPVVLVARLRFAFHAIAFATAMLFLPTRAYAQLGLSAGVDGGLSFVPQNQELVDKAAQRHNAIPTLGLGIDIVFYYMFNAQVGLGFAFAPAFFGAGAAPTPGLNFALSPRVVWRPGPVSLTLESGFVLSAFGDRCDADWKPVTKGCQPLRPAEPAGPGFGVAASALFPIWRADKETSIELGPAFRFQYARIPYDDEKGSFGLPIFQGVLALRVFLYVPPEKPH